MFKVNPGQGAARRLGVLYGPYFQPATIIRSFECSRSLIIPPYSTLCQIVIFSSYIKIFPRRIFGPKRNENGEWRRFHNEELDSLYHSPNIVRVIKSRRLRWAGYVARMEESRSTFKILTGKPTEIDLWRGLGVDGRTILEWTLKR